MTSAVCTLFEGEYHYGVGSLVNSLHANGFRGEVYAGFRGKLPAWAIAKKHSVGSWKTSTCMEVADGLDLIFVPLDTTCHLTNYKPHFMIDVLDGSRGRTDNIVYFDPDITLQQRWPIIEEWTGKGCLVCADTNWNMPSQHPIRDQWLQHFKLNSVDRNKAINYYINAGFVSCSSLYDKCLQDWRKLIQESKLDLTKMGRSRRPDCFAAIDQDLLNLSLMLNSDGLNILGPDAMGFTIGSRLMTHAIMSPKPWNERPFHRILKGIGPSVALSDYLKATQSPIQIKSRLQQRIGFASIAATKCVNRFYRRSPS